MFLKMPRLSFVPWKTRAGQTGRPKNLSAQLSKARREIEAAIAEAEAERRALDAERRAACSAALGEIQAAYPIVNARGETGTLADIFAPKQAPGGTGDCAAPKLLNHAYRKGLKPVALAEFWWGPPPQAGDRREGAAYPACRGKCGPLLPFMMEGLNPEPPPLAGVLSVDADAPKAVYEDDDILVVNKPAGLLSVPGRGRALKDSVYARIQKRHPEFEGSLLVHRLDLETSGLLVIGKSPKAHRELQRLFAGRQVEKRYVAWIEGSPQTDEGVIDLPMRLNPDDRPRQVHDPVHGKAARTRWRVLERRGDRTRMALFPETGRTHQLRLHMAHPLAECPHRG